VTTPDCETAMLDGSLDVHRTPVVRSFVVPSDIVAVTVRALVAPTLVSVALPVMRIAVTWVGGAGAGVVGVGELGEVGEGVGPGLEWSHPVETASAAMKTIVSRCGFIRE